MKRPSDANVSHVPTMTGGPIGKPGHPIFGSDDEGNMTLKFVHTSTGKAREPLVDPSKKDPLNI